MNIEHRIAAELTLPERGVHAALELFDGGATVPFVARYRKEQTDGIDERGLRAILDRRAELVALEDRRAAILKALEKQGQAAPELLERIRAAETQSRLEDLYLPYKPKRRTRAQIAREKGLAPLADRILAQPRQGSPERDAAGFVDAARGVEDADAALAGAQEIVAEVLSERPEIREAVRQTFRREGQLRAERSPKAAAGPNKFEAYAEYSEPLSRVPSHRFLAIERGTREGALRSGIEVDKNALLGVIASRGGAVRGSPYLQAMLGAVKEAYEKRLQPSVENEVLAEAKRRADVEAAAVFAENLRHLLLSAPLGPKRVLGIDPGLRTGAKCAAIDETGRFLGYVTIYTETGSPERAARELGALIEKHRPDAIAIGNGTGGREVSAFVRKFFPATLVVSVSESGASVYSASDIAYQEFPDLDLTIRGAISIARRLQDPLAELVKLDPKSIGVGQYQHDVDQALLGAKLGEVVESCVSQVGVALNTASAALLTHVAGIGPKLAQKIVEHRDRDGPFTERRALLAVGGLGKKTYEQIAGFLRISGGPEPLDGSAVHPERYGLVGKMAKDLGLSVGALIGRQEQVAQIPLSRYVSEDVGEPTLRDILAELIKPGRDPRAEFSAPTFRDDLQTIDDLAAGMVLEGVVTNVTNFGAFVDLGVHQDGLVHVSELADRFVRDPAEVVRVGDRIMVRVLDVDRARKRIALSAKQAGGATKRS